MEDDCSLEYFLHQTQQHRLQQLQTSSTDVTCIEVQQASEQSCKSLYFMQDFKIFKAVV
jgi:hypothetical protein